MFSETVIIKVHFNNVHVSCKTMANGANSIKFYKHTPDETYYSREEIKDRMTDDYIRGLIEGEGYFGVQRNRGGTEIPVFILKMHVRDKELIEAIRDYLNISNIVYEYKNQGRHFAMFAVRDISSLKNKIVPLFKGKLLGYKGTQFDRWLKYFSYLDSLIYREDRGVKRQTVQ